MCLPSVTNRLCYSIYTTTLRDAYYCTTKLIHYNILFYTLIILVAVPFAIHTLPLSLSPSRSRLPHSHWTLMLSSYQFDTYNIGRKSAVTKRQTMTTTTNNNNKKCEAVFHGFLSFAIEFNFVRMAKRLWCCIHIVHITASTIIWTVTTDLVCAGKKIHNKCTAHTDGIFWHRVTTIMPMAFIFTDETYSLFAIKNDWRFSVAFITSRPSLLVLVVLLPDGVNVNATIKTIYACQRQVFSSSQSER